jgi:signal transduction histidine kinase
MAARMHLRHYRFMTPKPTDDTSPAESSNAMTDRWSPLRGSFVLSTQLFGVLVMATLSAFAFCLIPLGVGIVLFPGCVRILHRQAERLSETDERVTGIGFVVPHIPVQVASGFVGSAVQCFRLLTDRGVRYLLLWCVLDPFVGMVPAVMPVALIGWGLYGVVVMPLLYGAIGLTPNDWYAFIPITSVAALPYAAVLGCVFIVYGFRSGPWWLRLQPRLSARLIRGRRSDLRERVTTLTESRETVRDDAAAQLRRIERDVHDGAQAQLVAIGMKLGAAEALLGDNPNAALALIGQAREDSSTALGELRDLMRGIHPPVLADRGLGPALEAMAIESALPTVADVRLPDRLDAALEAAAYFATREILTNAAKHSGATEVSVTATFDDGRLRIEVVDDGVGGAVTAPGSGLAGIRRRLAAFDGTMTVTSPKGGPTAIALEVPCASSSPKTT